MFLGEFYVILMVQRSAVIRCCLQDRWSDSLLASNPEEFTFCLLWIVRMFTQEIRMEESSMDILNLVFSALNLLATVIIGVIQVTWMISKDVFQDRPRAKHDSHNKK